MCRVCYDFGMMILDGKKIAERMLAGLKVEIAGVSKKLRLAVVVVGEDPVIRSFIREKKKAADYIGIDVRVYPFPAEITTNELRKRISEIVHEKKNTGVIIQLPLPPHINKRYILNAIPPEKDPDVLSAGAVGAFAVGKNAVMPPVAGAVKTLFEEYGIDYQNKRTLIIGAGALVGRPVALWLLGEGVGFSVITEITPNPHDILRGADIVISGTGRPRSITGDMIKKDAVVIDAGTSESSGEIAGDVDAESIAGRASHLAPVPGGIGPLTVAWLLKNLVALARER